MDKWEVIDYGFKYDVVKVELKESGLGFYQLEHHTLPMDIVR